MRLAFKLRVTEHEIKRLEWTAHTQTRHMSPGKIKDVYLWIGTDSESMSTLHSHLRRICKKAPNTNWAVPETLGWEKMERGGRGGWGRSHVKHIDKSIWMISTEWLTTGILCYKYTFFFANLFNATFLFIRYVI